MCERICVDDKQGGVCVCVCVCIWPCGVREYLCAVYRGVCVSAHRGCVTVFAATRIRISHCAPRYITSGVLRL